MPAAGVVESSAAALGGDVAQWRQDLATSAALLVNAANSSPTNTPTPTAAANQWNQIESVLAADFSQTWQAVEQFQLAVLRTCLQNLDALSTDWYSALSGQPPPPAPPATGSGSGTGSTGSGHGSSGSQSNNVLLSSHGSGSGSGSTSPSMRSGSSPLLSSGSGYGSGSGGSVSGQVWLDSDYDGIEQAPESGMAGITVTLETEDSAGNILNSTPTTTDANGNYNFTLPSGGSGYLYQIYVAIPSGYEATIEDASSSGIVSDIDPNGYSPYIPWGASTTIDAGLDYSAAPIAASDSYSVIYDNTLTVSAANGVLANDIDPNNLPLTASLVSGPSNGTLQLNGDGSFSYTPNAGYVGGDSFIYSASDGTYSSDATVSLSVDSTVSGQVWLDSNEDGIEDNGETGMSGVTVDLVTPNGATVSSTTTDANGDYQLAADPTLSSQYQIQVIIPTGYSATIPFASSSGIYSSIDYNGLSNVLTLPASGGISNVNAGLVSGNGPLGSISGEVWLDSDNNGLIDNSEGGLQAINVNLLNGSGTVVDSTSTDANGDYSFYGLTPNTPYTVQFVAPSGYTFVPQNVGPPATSSSAGPNGDTNPITLSPGQYDTTVNAGLNGDTPIVYQTQVYMTAENDSYTNIDFTADGYDPNGEPLTPIIVQPPSVGSVTYNSSTGLYDYMAPTNYTGLDSFEFDLSNGHAVSQVVTVQVLAYTGLLEPGVYDSFPAMAAGLFDGNNGQPLQSSIKQGAINDCWFVSAAAGLAQQNPNEIVGMITYNPGPNTYSVKFGSCPLPFGKTSVVIPGCLLDGHTYSTANGDWLRVLEKAYGQMCYNAAVAQGGWSRPAYDYINTRNLPSYGVEGLTGHSTDVDYFWCTRDSTTRQKLANAFANDKVVTAQTFFSGSSNQQMANKEGLVANHVYTVVAYDATNDRVRLYNPHQSNRWYNRGLGLTFRGQNDSDNPTHANNGYFWMSLSLFTQLFSGICYEE